MHMQGHRILSEATCSHRDNAMKKSGQCVQPVEKLTVEDSQGVQVVHASRDVQQAAVDCHLRNKQHHTSASAQISVRQWC